jgi:hydrogenase maturation protease
MKSCERDQSSGIILIGYGNELRGDDAVGPRIARIVAGWEIEGVESRACHQLLPELAENLARKQYALFVDASLDSEAKDVSVETVMPTVSNAVDGHLSDPGSLLALSQALYGQTAQAWQVRVPVARCDLGADLSTLARASLNAALAAIRPLLSDWADRTASRHA